MASYFLDDMALVGRLGGKKAAQLIAHYNRKNENFRRTAWNAHPLVKGKTLPNIPKPLLRGDEPINMATLGQMMQARHQGIVDRQSPGPLGRKPAGSDPYITHSAPGMGEDHMSRMMRDAERTIVHNLPGPVAGVQHVNPAAFGMGPPGEQAMAHRAAQAYGRQQEDRENRRLGAQQPVANLGEKERRARMSVPPRALAAWKGRLMRMGINPNEATVIGGDPEWHLVRE